MSLQKEEGSKLIIELFGEGNVILIKEGSIAALLRRRKVKHRDLRPKGAYEYPPETLDPRTVDKAGFVMTLKESKADLVRMLATRVNLGGDYAEEVCLRAGVAKQKSVDALDESQIDGIWREVGALVGRLETETAPHICLKDGGIASVSPISMASEKARA